MLCHGPDGARDLPNEKPDGSVTTRFRNRDCALS
jgi:hypothetical protein